MRRAGTIAHSAGGVLIARCDTDSIPDLGTATIDANLDAVGEIVDVFGPIEHPYLAITPADAVAATSLIGDQVYIRD